MRALTILESRVQRNFIIRAYQVLVSARNADSDIVGPWVLNVGYAASTIIAIQAAYKSKPPLLLLIQEEDHK